MADDQPPELQTPAVTLVSLGTALIQRGMVIPSFAQFAMSGEDNLQITTIGSIADTVLVQGRFLDAPSSKILPFAFAVPVGSNRVPTIALEALGTGYLLNITAIAASGAAPQIGQIFVIIEIVRGLSGATILLGTLVAGYLTSTQSIGWPGTPIDNTLTQFQGSGRIVLGTTPALGINILETIPTSARFQILAIGFQLFTSVVAANRRVFLAFVHSTFNYVELQAAADATANQVAHFTWGWNLPLASDVVNAIFSQPIPADSLMFAGDTFSTITNGLDPGDQFSAPRYLIREWMEVS